MKMENQIPINASCMSKACVPSCGVMALSGLLGGASLVLFGIFLYTGLPGQINLGFNEQTNLFIDTLLCFLFFLQHSLMVRSGFRKWLSGFYVTFRFLRTFDPLGIRQIVIHLKGKAAKEPVFTVRGAYRWVRHPLYFFSLLMIWAATSVTTDRLLFNGLWTVWIIIGAFLEERDLIASFGDAYRNYQRRVPMLIPYNWRSWRHFNN